MTSTPAHNTPRSHRPDDDPAVADTGAGTEPGRTVPPGGASAPDGTTEPGGKPVPDIDAGAVTDTRPGRGRTTDPGRDQTTGSGTVPTTDQAAVPSTGAVPSTVDEPTAGIPATPAISRTRISGTWVAIIVAAIVLIFLLVFVLQNLTTVTVNFLGFSGSLPLGVALLFAAIAGAILVALVGTARILQLRKFARRVGTRTWSPRRRS